ncbi:MAG TPA: DNA-processing protein DprA [Bryobacteraceae bacterium]|nr:DNA-processing protein DprA [Bryobacteraceae bacterium]
MRIPTSVQHKILMQPATSPDYRDLTSQENNPPPLLSEDEIIHWLALRMTPGLGTRKAGQLIEIFRTPQAIFRATRSELQGAGLAAAVAQSVASGCGFEDAADQRQRMAAANAEIIPIRTPLYSVLLREIFDPPPVLFARGRTELLHSPMVAIVGTRRPTPYGTAAATRIARDLAYAGLTISSGMARGIDTAAHRAALDAGSDAGTGGNTIAVFGCGVDQVYPAENRKLADEIAEKGLIVSEFPMGAPPYPQNFPIRNRIISGMSLGVLVVEGGEYSGSAITAKLAAEQGREVFAIPGNITSKLSWGPNLLIKQGAKLVQEWNDVVAELKPEVRRELVGAERKRLNINENEARETNGGGSASIMNSVTQSILKLLEPDASKGLDLLIEQVIESVGESVGDQIGGASPSEIIAALFELELSGLVRQLPGKCYIRVWAD